VAGRIVSIASLAPQTATPQTATSQTATAQPSQAQRDTSQPDTAQPAAAAADADDALWRQAEVDFGGVRQQVSLACLPEARVGDRVLVHVGLALSLVLDDDDEASENEVSENEASGTEALGTEASGNQVFGNQASGEEP
jgi:hydrogenase expression/formation protein HypC